MTNLHVSLKLVITLLVWFAFLPQSFAKTVRYELTVRNEKVNLSGKKTVDFALTVNGGIPAPALEFTEGDDAEILVKNALAKEEVSIHWHGLLLPPEEDGVAYVNTPPIHPGTSRLFKFKLRQNGTYWYHSHTAVQEQKGVYGAFIIHPKKKAIAYDKDAVLVLSDWSDENADQIIRNLRKDGDFYLYKKNSVRSYIGAIKAGGLKTHLQNEWTRMGGMDLSDVGYDAFLINGKRDSQLLVAHPGEKIRLRIINAGASSYFYVSMGIPMQVIAADGVDTKPVMANEILMGMAETYDVLFTVPDHKNYEIRATAQDVTGFASAWIGMGERVSAPDKPQPDLYASMDHMGHGASGMPGMDHSKMKGMDHSSMSGMDHSPMSGMDHTKMSHSTHVSNETSVETTHGQHEGHQMSKTGETQNIDVAHDPHQGHQMSHDAPQIDPHTAHSMHSSASTKPSDTDSVIDRSLEISPINFESQSDAVLKQNATPRDFKDGSKVPVVETLTVDSLKALTTTTLPKNAKIHDLKLVLGGDMVRYIWHINGKAISQDRLLMINEGEIVRFTFQNDTMMHHPMHLHGHFFRVINENGDRSPLKHTVDVPPHGTRTIEFYANEPGQWMLHCHNLYHMKTGMARVVRYSDFKLTPDMEKYDKHDPHLHDHLYTYSRVEGGSNHAQLEARVMRTWDALNLQIESADIDGKNFSSGKDWYTEGDLFYERWFGRFIHAFGGGSIYDQKGYGTVGFGMILPLLVQSEVSINHEGLFRLDLDKRFQWTKNIFSDAEFSWRPGWGGKRDTEYEVSLMYGPSWAWSAGLMATEKSVGIGAQIQF